MILESLVTTLNVDGSPNLAPLGAITDEHQTQFVLRPFEGTVTLENLRRHPYAVLHVVDDILLLVRSALNLPGPTPDWADSVTVNVPRLADCCRRFELEVRLLDDRGPRTEWAGTVRHRQEGRGMWGWNRARHAVLEATILATRLHLIPSGEIDQQFRVLEQAVLKTAGTVETSAWELVINYVDAARDRQPR